MRIALINPVARRCQGYHTIGSKIPQLGLQVLARLTPKPHTVDLIDEIFGLEVTDRQVRRGRYDLVGITSYSSGATRAYEIAARCRTEGIPTIMGGPHAWAVPEEPARYVDSVAVGECDEIWPEIIADAERGALKSRYDGRLAPTAPMPSGAHSRADTTAGWRRPTPREWAGPPSTFSRSTVAMTSPASRPRAAARSGVNTAA